RTASGKIDRGALAECSTERVEKGVSRVGTGSRVYDELTAIWEQVLGVSGVRPDDGFFDLGGHSLLALRVVARVRETFELPTFSLECVFAEPRLAGMAALVESQLRSSTRQPRALIPRVS